KSLSGPRRRRALPSARRIHLPRPRANPILVAPYARGWSAEGADGHGGFVGTNPGDVLCAPGADCTTSQLRDGNHGRCYVAPRTFAPLDAELHGRKLCDAISVAPLQRGDAFAQCPLVQPEVAAVAEGAEALRQE